MGWLVWLGSPVSAPGVTANGGADSPPITPQLGVLGPTGTLV